MKRYIIELDAYLYADNDQEARDKAQALAKKLEAGEDNSARVTGLHENEFGSISVRSVDTEI